MMRAVDPGYNPGIFADYGYRGQPLADTFDSAQRKRFNQELLARLRALPGVAVAYTRTLPLIDTGIIGKARVTAVAATFAR